MPRLLTKHDSEVLRERLRRYVRTKQYSIAALAKMLGCSRVTVYKIIKPASAYQLRLQYAKALSERLNIALADLCSTTPSSPGVKAIQSDWRNAAGPPQARAAASRLSRYLAEMALMLCADSIVTNAVTCDFDTKPAMVQVTIAKRGSGTHLLTVYTEQNLRLAYQNPDGKPEYDGELNEVVISRIFNKINK